MDPNRLMRSTAGGLLAASLVGAGLAARRAVRRSLPPHEGTLHLPQLHGEVEVLRDAHGVPAIFAADEHDANIAHGFVQASERLFQLDVVRRVGHGRLAEAVGRQGLPIDRYVRLFDFASVTRAEADALEAPIGDMLDWYTTGVNAAFAQAAQRGLPPEYRLLRLPAPEPWRPPDCLLFSKLLALGLDGNWEAELVRAELLQRFGEDVLTALDGDLREGSQPGTIDEPLLRWVRDLLESPPTAVAGIDGTGSNAWVIGSGRTASGAPLLANDPHLDLAMPALFFEVAMHCPTLELRGFASPGSPGVVLGRNAHIAWGATYGCADVQDLAVERPGTHPGTYIDADGSERRFGQRIEEIKVRGRRKPVRMVVRTTRRGPVLSDVVDNKLEHPVSLRWDSVLKPGSLPTAVWNINRATDWTSFRNALRHWTSPTLNMLFAGADGEIGYQLAGQVPLRRDADGSVPLFGDDPAGEWIDNVPFDELPSAHQPASGFVVTANDRILPQGDGPFVSREWMNGYRAARIRELVCEHDGHDVARQIRMQCDVGSLAGRELVIELEHHDPRPPGRAACKLLGELRTWDCVLDDSPGANAYRAMLPALQATALGFLGASVLGLLGHSRTNFVDGFSSMWERTTPRIFDAMRRDDTTMLELGARHVGPHCAGWKPSHTWRGALERALEQAAGAGARNEPHWRWFFAERTNHKLRLAHPLGAIPLIGRLFSRGPYPVGGDPDTVWQASRLRNRDNNAAMAGPALRVVWDMADPDASRSVLAGGQSGNPASPHYDDQLRLWLAGDTKPAPFTEQGLRRTGRSRLVLRP